MINMAKTIFLQLDILVLVVLCFLLIDPVAASPSNKSLWKPNCKSLCGNISFAFPFGMGSGCFLDPWFEIDCQNETNNPIPYLKKLKLEVLSISLPKYYYNWTEEYYESSSFQYFTVKFPIKYSNPISCPKAVGRPPNLQRSPFFFSRFNIFAAVGCNVNAEITSNHSSVGCMAECSGGSISSNVTCSGIDGCCQTRLPSALQTLTDVEFINRNSTAETNEPQCNYAFVANQTWLQHEFTDPDSLKGKGYAPAVLQWGISNNSYHTKLFDDKAMYEYDPNANYYCGRSSPASYYYDDEVYFTSLVWTCRCEEGYDGNPYIKGGCHDINECEDPSRSCPGRCKNTQGSYHCEDPGKTLKLVMIGIGSGIGGIFLVFLGWKLYKIIKKIKEKKLKEKYFKQNGGLLLQQQLLSPEGNLQKGKLFLEKELQKATENFSESRILGKGGQGTVYKGMLTDGKIVAIKKALVIDEGNVEQFINEVMILSQINHRNIVKLLGCCLETEIPLLVYEFIPNGNLYEYLHESNDEYLVSWEVRLQLAIEIAGALFYLHSAASMPIYHRDIKSTNILLDEKYHAKIADFGTSRSIPLDQTHVTTLVQGTIGYLDPEYFQTYQFTDKSDVYSFGVVLVELLTREKPISLMRVEEGRNLATHFILSLEDGRLFDILDAQVLNQGIEEEIVIVANLARSCLQLSGRNRPTMKEVTVELEGIKKLRFLPNIKESEQTRMQIQYEDISRSPSAKLKGHIDVAASSDVKPLLHGRTW